jgi:flagellar basal-body rod protein FlgB
MEFARQSHLATGQNLANVNTPNYKTKEVSFDQLVAQLENGSLSSGSLGKVNLQDVVGLQDRADGNNVDLDRELAMLKKNALAYQTLTQLLGSKLGILQRAISG